MLCVMESPVVTDSRPSKAYEALENDVIGVFIGLVQTMGLPKSVGQIYGLLYISKEPKSMDDIRQRLQISLGSASQGLRLLRAIRAVKVVYEPGSRRDLFVAEVELRPLLAGFYREQMEPQLATAAAQLDALQPKIKSLGPKGEHLNLRFQRLVRWRTQGSRWISRIVRLLPF